MSVKSKWKLSRKEMQETRGTVPLKVATEADVSALLNSILLALVKELLRHADLTTISLPMQGQTHGILMKFGKKKKELPKRGERRTKFPWSTHGHPRSPTVKTDLHYCQVTSNPQLKFTPRGLIVTPIQRQQPIKQHITQQHNLSMKIRDITIIKYVNHHLRLSRPSKNNIF